HPTRHLEHALEDRLSAAARARGDPPPTPLDLGEDLVDLRLGDRARADGLSDRVEVDRVAARGALEEPLDEHGELGTERHASPPVGAGQSLRKPTATTAPSLRNTSAPHRHFSTTLPSTRSPVSSTYRTACPSTSSPNSRASPASFSSSGSTSPSWTARSCGVMRRGRTPSSSTCTSDRDANTMTPGMRPPLATGKVTTTPGAKPVGGGSSIIAR